LADEILGEREIEVFVRSWTMIPSSGGRFEVTVNGELVFSKKSLGRHAEPGEIRTAILLRLEALRPGSFSASGTPLSVPVEAD
jgi:selenoprotein W-related protein